MKIYVNEEFKIITLDIEPETYCFVFNSNQDREEVFGDLCDAAIKGYKYEPKFQPILNIDGSNLIDEITGELVYKLDDNNNKLIIGYSCYPFIDYQILELIQNQHEFYSKEIKSVNAKISYLSMMSGIDMKLNC